MRLFERFVIVGMVNTLVSFSVYRLLLYAGVSPPISYVFSFVAGIIISIELNTRFTYRAKRTTRVFAKYILVNLGSISNCATIGFGKFLVIKIGTPTFNSSMRR